MDNRDKEWAYKAGVQDGEAARAPRTAKQYPDATVLASYQRGYRHGQQLREDKG